MGDGPLSDPAGRRRGAAGESHPPDEPALWLRLVGGLAVYRGDRPQPATQVGSRKARTLLALLAVERGRVVSVDQVVEAVWGEAPPRRPADNVSTLVSRLRAALGPDMVVGDRAGYRLGPALRVDLYEAAAMVTEAEARLAGGEPARALVAAGRAVELLGGGAVLADQPDATWAEPARARHGELLRRARHSTAQAALRTGDPAAAVAAAAAAVTADPFDEPACRALMQAYAAAGEPARALSAYARLRAALADGLGADPSPATRALHVAILRNQVAAPAAPAPARSGPGGDAGLVGRDAEVARLAEAWTRAAGGACRLLLITGEAGIGKTRLADQVVHLAGATGGLVTRAGCHRVQRSLPLQPVVEALTRLVTGLPAATVRQLAGDQASGLAALSPEVSAMLGVPPLAWSCGEAYQRRCFDAVAGFLRRLSAIRPTLLVLDDLHDADPTTVQLMHYLARRAGDSRLLMVATLRPEAGGAALASLTGVADQCELGPLGPAAITRLAAAAGQLAQVERVARQTRGHTLLVVETLRGLAAGEVGVAGAVRAAVVDRVRRAGPQAEQLLRAAAVLGTRFTPAGVAALLDISAPEAARRCEHLLPTRLIGQAGYGYEFANHLIRQVVYEATPMPTRRAYHGAAAHLATGHQRAGAHATLRGGHHRAGGTIQRRRDAAPRP
jgi:DNA-binding SARP family transcriptional activator